MSCPPLGTFINLLVEKFLKQTFKRTRLIFSRMGSVEDIVTEDTDEKILLRLLDERDTERVGFEIYGLVVGNPCGLVHRGTEYTGTFGGLREDELLMRSGRAYGPGNNIQDFDTKRFPTSLAGNFYPQ